MRDFNSSLLLYLVLLGVQGCRHLLLSVWGAPVYCLGSCLGRGVRILNTGESFERWKLRWAVLGSSASRGRKDVHKLRQFWSNHKHTLFALS